MWIDFHVHCKLTKKSEFDLKYFIDEIEYAKESGLDAIILSEHFNTTNFYQIYDTLEKNFHYLDGHYCVNNFKVFAGLEVDVANGGHVILASDRENILQVRKNLEGFTEKGNFIAFNKLLNLAEDFNCLSIGAHPFRGEHPLALKQELNQMKRLDALDLNATDIFKKGLKETEEQVVELSKKLGIPILTGSDSHYPVQLGSVRTKLSKTCSTTAQIKECIKTSLIQREISKVLDLKVFAAKTTKAYLKAKYNV